MSSKLKYIILSIISIFCILIIIGLIVKSNPLNNDSHKNQESNNNKINEKKINKAINDSHVKNIGSKNAKNQLVVFFDYRCSHCRDFHNNEKNEIKKLIDNKQIKYAAIPYKTIDNYSDVFANMDRAAGEVLNDNDYLEFVDKAYIEASKSNPDVKKTISEFEDQDKIYNKYKSYEKNKIDNSIAERFGINSTPVIYINGKNVNNMDELKDQLK